MIRSYAATVKTLEKKVRKFWWVFLPTFSTKLRKVRERGTVARIQEVKVLK